MSQRSVQELLERMKSDDAFRSRVLGVTDVEARLALVRADGFDVTAEEIAAEAAQLSDEQLAQAVGAGSAACDVFMCSADDTCGG